MNAQQVLGAAVGVPLPPSAPAQSLSIGTFVNAMVGKDNTAKAKTGGGAAIGYYLYRKKHPVLGVLGGASVGRNVEGLLKADERKDSIRNLAITAASIGAVTKLKMGHPALRYVAAGLGAELLATMLFGARTI